MSSGSPPAGESFALGAICQPLPERFDAYGVARDYAGAYHSFDLQRPSRLRSGVKPLAVSVPGLSSPWEGVLLFIPSLPAGMRGHRYDFILGLVPHGAKPIPENAVPGYLWMGSATVR
jgi:hypothetical protein